MSSSSDNDKKISIDPQSNESTTTKENQFLIVLKNLSWQDFENIGKIPCARKSFLYGIGGGATIGSLRFLKKGNVLSASNWAVGSFCIISIGTWEYCRYKRQIQNEKFKIVVEQISELNRKKAQVKATEKAEELDN
ncbi:14814_t:CDS:2 [Funneliformis mosseae]|uniref:Cytochrome c oxidase assembly protein COX20, mitochondrial n=1 Tax=Funneliformis mosseae TaxID=27381 RepID=A0A9N9B596_FUNMO|nr:14814_t:CDS:2 [Funneliformis mosseae]